MLALDPSGLARDRHRAPAAVVAQPLDLCAGGEGGDLGGAGRGALVDRLLGLGPAVGNSRRAAGELVRGNESGLAARLDLGPGAGGAQALDLGPALQRSERLRLGRRTLPQHLVGAQVAVGLGLRGGSCWNVGEELCRDPAGFVAVAGFRPSVARGADLDRGVLGNHQQRFGRSAGALPQVQVLDGFLADGFDRGGKGDFLGGIDARHGGGRDHGTQAK